MRRLAAVVLVIGIVAGYAATLAWGGPDGIAPSQTPLPNRQPTGTRDPAEPAPVPDSVAATTTASTADIVADATYLVWSTGGLPAGLPAALELRFDEVSIVAGDVVELDGPGGSAIALDALALDPDAHRRFDPENHLSGLRPGTVVLGEMSGRLRDAEVGDNLEIDGADYEIVGIVPDETVAAAEVVFAAADPTHHVKTARYALIRTDMARTKLEATVRALYDGPAPLRIRSEGETPWLRHGDAVLPQVIIKQALGEFSYVDRTGAAFTQDPDFVERSIVTTDVPLLGEIVCHEQVAEMLRGAMTQLVDEGLGHLVDPAGHAGCWNPRFIRTSTGAPAGLSRHAWGAAVDINAPDNPYGSGGSQDPRLVAVMTAWGFTWGGEWLVPDPMHFEYGGRPDQTR